MIAIAVVAFLVLGVGLLVGFTRASSQSSSAWVKLATPIEMPEVVLTDTDGRPYDLRDQTAGQVTLLYFGYLNCPDACPIHMAVLGATFDQLEPDVRAQLNVVFVTTDPERDGPDDLREFLDRFDPDFVGLTGSQAELREAQVAAGVPVAVAEPADPDGDYLVGHATQVLVFDTDGIARSVYPFGVRQSDWVADLSKLVDT
ncbi:MAG: SCO family protein [Ilumatobacteraceae bacterium]|nr:SCO family protein [Ilumatobacteraceae bacterium]